VSALPSQGAGSQLWADFTILALNPACLDITVHAHVFGRPMGAIEFARSLALVQRHEGFAWLTEHDELGRMFSA